ncbi:MAG: ThiF family adenylyltransferase [Patescibacteria group bacterium]|nr:ThiF family adenylyltransferase [Patescibacteria group bacterium]
MPETTATPTPRIILDVNRHLGVFSPYKFGEKLVTIIGSGSTGSKAALGVAELGVPNIELYDTDVVVDHNVPNTRFFPSDVGKKKIEAMREWIRLKTGTEITIHDEFVDGIQTLGEVVFVLTDTMKSRVDIWNGSLKYKPNVKLVIETRMGADQGRIYVVNPINPAHVAGYEETLHYTDEDATPSVCRSEPSVGPTSDILSGLAIWQMMRWQSILDGEEDELENEMIFGLRPLTQIYSRKFTIV